jgi:hypothetical protein
MTVRLALIAAEGLLAVSLATADDTPAPYKRDVFEEREVEACAMAMILGAFPVQGGRDWVFDGVSGETVLSCDKIPPMKPSPLPRSILRGTGMDNWRLGSDGQPERVELRNGVPHRIVAAWAIGPKTKRRTVGPCHEPNPAVVCEGSEDGDFVTALRQLEASARRAEALIQSGKLKEAVAELERSNQLTPDLEGRKELGKDAIVKTSEGGLQSKDEVEKRIGRVLNHLLSLAKAVIVAKKSDAGSR